MTNADINTAFMEATDKATWREVVKSIAAHYDSTDSDIVKELTGDGAEHLLDYLQGPLRTATHMLMTRHGLCQAVGA